MPDRAKFTRREIIKKATLLAGGCILAGCNLHNASNQATQVMEWKGKKIRTIDFLGEDDNLLLETPLNGGLDGRLFTDLARLTPENLTTPTESFYIRTRCPDSFDFSRPWTIKIDGLVDKPSTLTIDQLKAQEKNMGIHLMECSGNPRSAHFGMISACNWAGVSVSDILSRANVLPSATQVLISGVDAHSRTSSNSRKGASWIFNLQEPSFKNAFLATQMNSRILTKDHGYPVRLLVPGWYGCACIKWVNQITLLDDSAKPTSQMCEFAGRTHQTGIPSSANQFNPATIDQAAMPIRIEQWLIDGKIRYRVIGIMWGGYQLTKGLAIRFNQQEKYVLVEDCLQKTNNTWTIWSHGWQPEKPGVYEIQLKLLDKSIRSKRLESGFYVRSVNIEEV